LVLASRLENVCVAFALSVWSLTRKPLFGLEDPYIAWTCEVTVHCRRPDPEVVVAAVPVEAGWLFHVAPASVQVAAGLIWKACKVRPESELAAVNLSVADVTEHPTGFDGSVKPTRARSFLLFLELTIRLVLPPAVEVGEFWSTYVSRSAVTV
jgi:hypothetical protein